MSLNRDAFVEEALDRILTQYRESPRLFGVIRYDVGQIADVAVEIDSIPSYFDIDTAVGDQLTLIGERMGWPRCHCVCVIPPLFGYPCEPASPNLTIVGYCEDAVFDGCYAAGSGDLCLNDDDVYRGYVKARRYQALQRYNIDDLQSAARHIWGNTAYAVNMGQAKACVASGRALTDAEIRELPLAFRVLPFAPGITTYVHEGDGLIFGYGSGWAGYCEDAGYFCPRLVEPYACA